VTIESTVAVLTGLVLFGLGLAFLRRHRRVWRRRCDDPTIDPGELKFYQRQYRRRVLTSRLITALGVLIPVGMLLLSGRPKLPGPVVILYWIGVLVVTMCVMSLGLIDLFATGMYTRDALTRVQTERAALERQLEDVRRSLRERNE
jgi:drug/metabolite transporter (DMT)-like permease